MNAVIAVLVFWLCLLSTTVHAQWRQGDPILLFDKPGSFKIDKWSVYGMSDVQYPAAEKEQNYKKLVGIIDALRRTPVLRSPTGFDLQVYLFGAFTDTRNDYGIPCNLSVQFCAWYRYKGKENTACIEPPHWDIDINQLRSVHGTSGFGYSSEVTGDKIKKGAKYEQWKEVAENLHDIILEPGLKETLAPGLDLYNRERIVIYNPDRPAYWLPVTVRYVYTLLIDYWRLHPDTSQSSFMTKMLVDEYTLFNEEERNSLAYQYGKGALAGVGTDSSRPAILRLNPNYWNKKLPRTAIQFMTLDCYADRSIYQRQQLEYRTNHSASYFISVLQEQLDVNLLPPLIDK